MFYTVYKTTHLPSGKIYIGMHTTAKTDDGYLGSGKLIARAIKKYGRDAFSKEVLFVFATPEEMIAKEKELVTEGFVLRDDTYNLNVGGDGGWHHANQIITPEQRSVVSNAGNLRQAELRRQDPRFAPNHRRAAAQKLRAWNASNLATREPPFTGRKHTEATKRAQRRAAQDRVGPKSSRFGSVWVCQEGHAPKSIPHADLSAYEAEGWRRGRK